MKLVIDTDPGIDDAIAILLATASPKLDLIALTTVGGNVGIDVVTPNALALLELAGAKDVPVYRGADRSLGRERPRASAAHGDDGLGGFRPVFPASRTAETESAVDFLLRITREQPGEITVLAIGPLTNIAEAVRRDPGFPGRVARLVLMGGAEGTGNITPSAEFNFWHDPEAASEVFAAGFDTPVMVGLDATRHAFMTPGVRELVRQIGTPTARFIHGSTRQYTDHYWNRYHEVGSELCDVLAVAQLIDPALVPTVAAHVEIETAGICEGRSVVARTARYTDRTANALVATDAVDTRGFFELLLGTLFPEHRADIERTIGHEYR
ncbi:nucleoside hydrolase [Mycetocola tolaasinivorans]|nr:nucleoside hydrolase [Mycetocola tolaasinivorans]